MLSLSLSAYYNASISESARPVACIIVSIGRFIAFIDFATVTIPFASLGQDDMEIRSFDCAQDDKTAVRMTSAAEGGQKA